MFRGDRLFMVSDISRLPCMGFVLAGGGDVIGIDSCSGAESERVEELVLSLGGRVHCWFLTHAHFDHIEGLIGILERGKVCVDAIAYRFPPTDYIERVERAENRVARVADLEAQIRRRGVPVILPEKGKPIQVGHFTVLPLSDGSAVGESLNPSSVVYRVQTSGDPVLFLGDMDWRAEDKILAEFPQEIRCPVVQMSHHGQQGVSERFYRAVSPKVCLWPTPEWLWNNDLGKGIGTGPFKTLETRAWMEKLGTVNYRFTEEVVLIR